MKRSLITLAVFAAGATLAAGAAAASPATLTIRHQLRGCHTWSLNGDPFAPSQTVKLARGTALTITNDDVMPHALVQLGGPAASVTNLMPSGKPAVGAANAHPGRMGRPGAESRVVFAHPGVYRFTTKAGEDYMPGVKTIGPDNVLKLTVVVR